MPRFKLLEFGEVHRRYVEKDKNLLRRAVEIQESIVSQ